MITGPRLVAAGLGSVVLVLGILALTAESCNRKGSEAKTQADVLRGEVKVHVETARVKDAAIEARTAELDAQDRDVNRKLAELFALRHKPVPVPAIASQGSLPTPVPQPVEPGLADVVAKQDEVIRAQALEITTLKAQVLDLTGARDQWKAALLAEQKRSAALEVVLRAQASADKASEWKTGIKGALAGAVVGYLANRG